MVDQPHISIPRQYCSKIGVLQALRTNISNISWKTKMWKKDFYKIFEPKKDLQIILSLLGIWSVYQKPTD